MNNSRPASIERVLIVGLGSIGRRHAGVARSLLPDAEIVALRRPESKPAFDENVSRTVSAIDEALEFRPQIAVIASPATYHLESATALAREGAHLFVEKPIAASVKGVPELIGLARENGVTLMTGYNLRFAFSLQAFRGLLLEKRVGSVLSVRAEVGQYLPAWRPAADYRAGVSANAVLGGGVLVELSHEIDYLRWIFGEIDWVSAVVLRQSALEIDVEDTAHLVLGFAPRGGETPLVASLTMDFIRRDATRECVVIGESGSLRWNGIAGTVEVFDDPAEGWKQLHASKRDVSNSYRAEWEHFLGCVSKGEAPLVSGDDGLAVLRVVDAARRSSSERRWVMLSESA